LIDGDKGRARLQGIDADGTIRFVELHRRDAEQQNYRDEDWGVLHEGILMLGA